MPSRTIVKKIPEPSLRRLPTYLFHLKHALEAGESTISCTRIAAALSLDPTGVRKDLEATGITGTPGVGYNVPLLIDTIETFLGLRNVNDAFLAGAGHLGAALLRYPGFKEAGLNIVAAFDITATDSESTLNGVPLLSTDQLGPLARRMAIRIGIIAVPAAAANAVARTMSDAGIIAIWNFSPVTLALPEHIIVENVNLTSSLAVLSSKLRTRLSGKKKT